MAEPRCPICQGDLVVTEPFRPRRVPTPTSVGQFVIGAALAVFCLTASQSGYLYLGLGTVGAVLAVLAVVGWVLRSRDTGIPNLNTHTCIQCQHSWFSPALKSSA